MLIRRHRGVCLDVAEYGVRSAAETTSAMVKLAFELSLVCETREVEVQEANENVKTTPQMTRFRDGKVCNNWLQMKIDDHRIQSDDKCKSGLQNPKGKNSALGIASAW